jgi:hypothetical protein
MTLAERIVSLMRSISDRYHQSDDPEVVALAYQARVRYSQLKSEGYDFATCSTRARVEAVEQLLTSSGVEDTSH